MRFEVLGPLRVLRAGADVTPRGRLGLLALARLVIGGDQPVAADVLAELLWPEDPSPAVKRVPLVVHRLRSMLDDPARLGHEPRGYRLRVAADELDLARFDELAAGVLGGAYAGPRLAVAAREALELWRGEALAGLPEFAVDPEVRRWTDLRQAVRLQLFEAEVDAGRADPVRAELQEEAERNPLDERLQALLMRALTLSGRAADALAVYRRTHRVMDDELGVPPGAELRDLQAAILAGEPETRFASRRIPSQLPAGPAELTGRDDELARLDELTATPAPGTVCVVTGTAGCGKTSLVLHWAQRHRDDFPDGQLFVDLRGFSADAPASPADVLGAFLRSLSSESPPAGLDERAALFRTLLDGRRVLVVLDNARSADQVRPLLPGPGSVVLVTSRASLGALSVQAGARSVLLERLTEANALALLGRAIGDPAGLDSDAARRIVHRCARLPLALLIAAHRIDAHPTRSLDELAGQLDDELYRLDLLDTGDGPDTDVRAVFSWSYDAVGEGPARLFRYLGLLPGEDADLDTLTVLSGGESRDVRRDLAGLVRAHLVDETEGGRFRQHDLLRAYARELADRESAELRSAAARRLLQYYAYLSVLANRTIRPAAVRNSQVPPIGPPRPELADTASARDWLDREWPNVQATIDAADVADLDLVVELTLSWHRTLQARGDLSTLLRLTRRGLEIAHDRDDGAREAYAANRLALACALVGKLDEARRHLALARRLQTGADDRDGLAMTLANDSYVATMLGDLPAAIDSGRAALRLHREAGTSGVVKAILTNLGYQYTAAGRYDEAVAVLDEVLQLCRADGDRQTLGVALTNRALWASRVGRPEEGLELAAEALSIARTIRDRALECMALHDQAEAQLALGDLGRARALVAESVRSTVAAGDVSNRARLLDLNARIAAATDPRRALPYFQECLRHAESNQLGLYAAMAREGIEHASRAAAG